MRSSRVVVIGSNAFSGACFVDFALDKGAEVVGISRSDEPDKVFLPYRWKGNAAGFRFVRGDLNHDLDGIMTLINAERPEYVVNFAAQSMVGESWTHPEHWYMTNVVSTAMLHERLRHCDFLRKYIHVTTPEVYGSTDGYIDEDTPFNPSTPYAVSRAAADMNLNAYVSAYGLRASSTRAANVYGPGQQLYRIIPRTIFFLRTGRRLTLHGGGVSRRSFIHMDDVSEATWRIMQEPKAGEVYHISTDEVVTIRELVERICKKLDVSFDDGVDVGEERLGKDAAYLLDSTKLRDALGWTYQVSLDQGLDRCIGWVDANLDELVKQPHEYIHKP